MHYLILLALISASAAAPFTDAEGNECPIHTCPTDQPIPCPVPLPATGCPPAPRCIVLGASCNGGPLPNHTEEKCSNLQDPASACPAALPLFCTCPPDDSLPPLCAKAVAECPNQPPVAG